MIYFGSSVTENDNTYRDVMYSDTTINVWINISELNSLDVGGRLIIISGQPGEGYSTGGCEDDINHWGLYVANVAGNEFGVPIIPGGETFELSVFSYTDIGMGDPSTFVTLNAFTGEINANQWYMLTVTHDSATHTWKMYVNGDLESSITMPAGIGPGALTRACSYAIGNRPINNLDYTPANGQPFPGRIDELGFWNQVLTPEQIAALYGMK
jgi:hypothetical protein